MNYNKIAFQVTCIFICLLFLPLTTCTTSTAGVPRPPQQPTEGPGGSNYTHNSVTVAWYGYGARRYWLFQPDDPQPTSAPVIIFNHGWSAIPPFFYQAWINHIVRRGNIVIYPQYQLGLVIGSRRFYDNAVDAVLNAKQELENPGHVTADWEKLAIVGHSLGGGISMYMASIFPSIGLPAPKAIMPVQPAVSTSSWRLINYSSIDNKTLLIVLVGEDDTVVGNYSGIFIFNETSQIPLENKEYIIQRSDTYGSPSLLADHMAPLATTIGVFTNAMDYYSTWKLFDALTDYAFFGTNKEYAFGNTSQQRSMGQWSDGTPVAELVVTKQP